jgi:hypothetical protein
MSERPETLDGILPNPKEFVGMWLHDGRVKLLSTPRWNPDKKRHEALAIVDEMLAWISLRITVTEVEKANEDGRLA